VFTPEAILQKLQEQMPVALADLPNEHGVYALFDHSGSIRYIGVTESPDMGFWRRIFQYHVTGSEGRSHKFSQAYNTGRMWRSRKGNPEQLTVNAKLAKSLRTKFCRTYCKATYVAIPRSAAPDNFFQFLTQLESQIQRIAPSVMRTWEGIKFRAVAEPIELVDKLIASAGFSSTDCSAFDTQALLCVRVSAGEV
jgi:hypothetical protein